MSTMKAIRIHEYGGTEVMRYEEAPLPEPDSDELLVRVVAAGVNPIDWKTRAGLMKDRLTMPLPWIVGTDFSGVVERVGHGGSEYRAGDEVFGKADLPRDGSYAQFVVVPRSAVAPKPASLDHIHAAVVPLAALTAWQALFGGPASSGLELTTGQTLLILGAAGGVGSFAVQLAKARGLHVLGLVLPGQESFVTGLGADEVSADASLRDIGEVDGVLDLVGGDARRAAFAHVKRGGAFASTLGGLDAEAARERGVRALGVATQTHGEQLRQISRCIDSGEVQVIVSEVLPLASARRAHDLLEQGGLRGKIALWVSAR